MKGRKHHQGGSKEAERERVSLLEKELEKQKVKFDECLADLQKERADFINFKERVKREQAENQKYANQVIVEEFLEIKDNLERALAGTSNPEAVTDGVRLTLKQLENLLGKHNIVELDPQGEKFDPQYHEALMVEEGDVSEETVGEVLQKGYVLHSRVVRPAKVKIIKPKGEEQNG